VAARTPPAISPGRWIDFCPLPISSIDQTNTGDQIVLTKDDLRQLAFQWLAQGRPLPTAEEMRGLIEQKISQEILSREAVALGLDKNDEIIKRRLAQKMDFLAADVAALQSPSDAELRAWFTQNAARFALPPRVSFRHLYYSFDRGPEARDAATAALAAITARTADPAQVAADADLFMFRDYYAERAPDQVAKEFGPQFASALFELKPGVWQGPIQSGYGWHLIFIDSMVPGRLQIFEELLPEIKAGWVEEKQREIKRIAFEAMRARYKITVAPIESADLASLAKAQTALVPAGLIPQ
jgi:peptidyl-prolyl cis-trans isomerase C